ncbi:MAG TPA: SIMPL domain-containing protein [Acetobacteraceae bacterium]|nr:SIMPL domain-containing protein [Acetobacteraceae bacterium]
MRTAFALLLLALCLAAQASAETVLQLSNSGTVSVQPDELVATLRAEAVARTAAAAQEAVNAAIGKALDAGRGVTGVRSETGRYNVWSAPPPNAPTLASWHASQAITLRSDDGTALLRLVGMLQQQGLAVEQLGWRLSEAAARQARGAALREAVTGLRSQADAIAALLGLHFGSFKSVRVGLPEPSPVPVPMRAMALAASAPPNAESGPVTVEASVSAEVVLEGGSGSPAAPEPALPPGGNGQKTP